MSLLVQKNILFLKDTKERNFHYFEKIFKNNNTTRNKDSSRRECSLTPFKDNIFPPNTIFPLLKKPSKTITLLILFYFFQSKKSRPVDLYNLFHLIQGETEK